MKEGNIYTHNEQNLKKSRMSARNKQNQWFFIRVKPPYSPDLKKKQYSFRLLTKMKKA